MMTTMDTPDLTSLLLFLAEAQKDVLAATLVERIPSPGEDEDGDPRTLMRSMRASIEVLIDLEARIDMLELAAETVPNDWTPKQYAAHLRGSLLAAVQDRDNFVSESVTFTMYKHARLRSISWCADQLDDLGAKYSEGFDE
tara:strand:+ start:3387 stop:3809 length:423 start_codon:yes stop_codon:yes gene_type:complete